MGKKKFEKNKGVTFKLVFRSSDDQENSDKTLSDRIFSVIEDHKKKADKEQDKERQKILSQFTAEELGKAPPKKSKDLQKDKVNKRDDILSHTKGRDDLWITHLMKMKEIAKAEAEAEEEEEEEEQKKKKATHQKLKKAAPAAPAKKEGEKKEEEWESCEDDDEEGEWEDEDEEDEEEEDEEEEEAIKEEEEEDEEILVKRKVADEDEEKEKKEEVNTGNKETKIPDVTEEDFPQLGAEGPSKPSKKGEEHKTKEQVIEELAEEEIDLKKVQVKGNVRMKRYDELGLPIDGYNYYQHIADPNSGGAPTFAFVAQYDKVVKLPEDLDLKVEKMNKEEKEILEALEYEGEAPVYETLEDDFLQMLTKEDPVQVVEGEVEVKKDGKKVSFGGEEIKEILATKDGAKKNELPKPPEGKDSIYNRKDFQKVLNQHVNFLKEKYKEEREKNKIKYNLPDSEEEEEEVEEVEEVESFDEEDENSRPKDFVERLKFEEDIAAQQAIAKSLSDLDSSFEEEERRTRASKAGTQVSANYFPGVPVRKAKLNIVKEQTNDKKTKEDKEGEKEKKEGEEKESDDEEEEEEEEENDKSKVQEVFRKRERNETKEEKKQRKELVKQFKQERKEKKKKFKENFEAKKKEHTKVAVKQANKLQGLSIYKLTA